MPSASLESQIDTGEVGFLRKMSIFARIFQGMGDTNLRAAFLQLHLSVLLAGFTGLFGKLITLNEATLTWYRL